MKANYLCFDSLKAGQDCRCFIVFATLHFTQCLWTSHDGTMCEEQYFKQSVWYPYLGSALVNMKEKLEGESKIVLIFKWYAAVVCNKY